MSTNGKIADAQLASVDGWARLTFHTAAAFLAAAAFILLHYGIRPRITSPYGAYRSLSMQQIVKVIYGKLAATPGYSPHGLGIAFDMDNVTAIARAVGGIAVLDGIMARFGFNRNASNGSGGIEEWHYTLVAVVDLAGVAGMHPTLVNPIALRRNTMATLYFIIGSSPAGWALGGDSPGTPANWLETNDQTVANSWAAAHGDAVQLTLASFLDFKSKYTQPLRTLA